MGQVKKIALVHDFLFTYGGAERVLSTFHRMYPEAPIYTMLADPKVVEKHFPKARIITSSLQRSPLRRKPQFLVAAMPRAIEEFNFNEYDLVLSSSGAFSHGIITGPDTIHICYCHTPMRYVWDWQGEYLRERGITRPFSTWLAETVLSNIRVWDKVAAERPDIWLANSKIVQARIKRYYNKPSKVIYPPVDTEYFNPDILQKKSIARAITVGRLSPYKRVDIVIEACKEVGLNLRVGGDGHDRERLEKLSDSSISFAGSLSESEKRQEIVNSSCFIFAAEDDFGIAPVEALALGVPVIALAKGGALEYIQDGKNGILFAEPTVTSLSEALCRFQKEGVSWDSEQIRKSALAFSTEVFTNYIHQEIEHAFPV